MRTWQGACSACRRCADELAYEVAAADLLDVCRTLRDDAGSEVRAC